MSKIIGYMATWTTYGSWLPGDKRGYVNDGEILPGNAEILQRSKQRQTYSTVLLDTHEKQIVRQTIIAEAEKIGQKIEALAANSNHIHLLARHDSESIETTVNRYKSLTTRALWQLGRKGRIWTKGFDKRFCFTETDIAVRTRYIQNHLD